MIGEAVILERKGVAITPVLLDHTDPPECEGKKTEETRRGENQGRVPLQHEPPGLGACKLHGRGQTGNYLGQCENGNRV